MKGTVRNLELQIEQLKSQLQQKRLKPKKANHDVLKTLKKRVASELSDDGVRVPTYLINFHFNFEVDKVLC